MISSDCLRRSKVFLVSTALTLTALCGSSIPSLAKPQPNPITQKRKPQPNSIAQKNKPKTNSTTQKTKPKPNSTTQKTKPKPNRTTQKIKPKLNPIAQKIKDLQKSNKRWIQVNLSKQKLIAWQGKKQVYAVLVSTGKRSTPTIPGVFTVKYKLPTARMKGDDYDVPNVPYTMYYDVSRPEGSYAIHGAYWHNRFGTPVSHGCTNVAVNHAKWLFNWASLGTPVVVNK
ncbi:MAG: L,D-transpeptidase family protein [Aphanothece sp. CMT-3BRIN-NPC111]|nr:L,D-transpeptidase family protein [Aphanothece sp. CMT-3BRIN-NPC111]